MWREHDNPWHYQAVQFWQAPLSSLIKMMVVGVMCHFANWYMNLALIWTWFLVFKPHFQGYFRPQQWVGKSLTWDRERMSRDKFSVNCSEYCLLMYTLYIFTQKRFIFLSQKSASIETSWKPAFMTALNPTNLDPEWRVLTSFISWMYQIYFNIKTSRL